MSGSATTHDPEMNSPPNTASAAGRSLRVGIVTDGLDERIGRGGVSVANGGVGVYIHRLISALQAIDDGHQFFLIRCGEGRLDIYQRTPSHSVFLRGGRTGQMLGRFDVPFARIADRLRLDVLHFPNQFGGALLPRRIKRVVTLHDLTPLVFPRHHPLYRVVGYRVLLRRALQRADRIVVPSQHTRADLIRRGLAAAEQIAVIPEAAAIAAGSNAAAAVRLDRYRLPTRYLLSVGVLEPRKNHRVLVQALERLRQEGEDVGLVIAGRDGWRWSDPLADSSLVAMRPFVRVLRNVPDDDLAALYRGATAFAYPSLYEGFGLPVLEAMACGVPVVAANTSALPEVTGGAALLADPRDAGDFTAKLLLVLRDASARERLIFAGNARAQQFTWERTARHTLDVYASVCERDIVPPRSCFAHGVRQSVHSSLADDTHSRASGTETQS